MNKKKVFVIGLGEVGLPTAKYFVGFKHLEVYGYDISPSVTSNAKHIIKAVNAWEELPMNIDVYIITVSTGLKDGIPDVGSIFDVAEKINQHLENRDDVPLVSVESTVVPGTCRRLHEKLRKYVNLIHVPHRFWGTDPVNYGVKQLRIIGAIDSPSLKKGMEFYASVGIPLCDVRDIETAEMSKIVENAYRFVEIAFAEDLNMICKKHKIDFNELRKACNTLVRGSEKENWKVQIMEARNGIGGHCLPKDIRYLLSLSPGSQLLNAAILADELYKAKMKRGSA
jgi:nucleotide sugar dehydrogenase